MNITNRDIQLLLWINGFGFVFVLQIAKWMGTDFSTAARRVRLLIKAGLLRRIKQKGLSGNPVVVTPAGTEVAGDDLPPLKGIRPGEYRHDAYLVDVGRGLAAIFPGSRFEPGRRVQQALGRGHGRHLPDAYLYRENGERIIIELELALKSRHRIASILAQHTADLEATEIWYLTDSEAIARAIKRASAGLDHVKVVGVSRKVSNHTDDEGAT